MSTWNNSNYKMQDTFLINYINKSLEWKICAGGWKPGPNCCMLVFKKINKQLYTKNGDCKCFKIIEQQLNISRFVVVIWFDGKREELGEKKIFAWMETPLKFTDWNGKLTFPEMVIYLKTIGWKLRCRHSVSARAYVCKRERACQAREFGKRR